MLSTSLFSSVFKGLFDQPYKYNMKLKYATLGKAIGSGGKGRKSNPNCWKTGPDLLTREKYYAYLKHKSQANYRGEEHTISWDFWQNCWTDDVWFRRGRKGDSLILGRINWDEGWHENNVEIMTRRKHFDIRLQRGFHTPKEDK